MTAAPRPSAPLRNRATAVRIPVQFAWEILVDVVHQRVFVSGTGTTAILDFTGQVLRTIATGYRGPRACPAPLKLETGSAPSDGPSKACPDGLP